MNKRKILKKKEQEKFCREETVLYFLSFFFFLCFFIIILVVAVATDERRAAVLRNGGTRGGVRISSTHRTTSKLLYLCRERRGFMFLFLVASVNIWGGMIFGYNTGIEIIFFNISLRF